MGSEVEEALKALGVTSIHSKASVGGGSISQGFTYTTDKGKYFVKVCIFFASFLLFILFFLRFLFI
jgi:fructosamine-3-kinase